MSQDLLSSPLPSSGGKSEDRYVSLPEGEFQSSEDPFAADDKECNICFKTFKTVANFKRHKVIHIQEESTKKLSREHLLIEAEPLAEQKLRQIQQDISIDDFGEEKKRYIGLLLGCLHIDHWKSYLMFIVEKMLDILLKRSRALPMKQFQEHLYQFNHWLAEITSSGEASDLLKSVVDGSEEVIRNVNYRFCTVLFESVAALIVRHIASKTSSDKPHEAVQLNFSEKQSLYYAGGYILRAILSDSRKKKNRTLWDPRVRCIRERMCFRDDGDNSDELLKIKEWYDRLDRGGLTAISDIFFKFICEVELVIRRCIPANTTTVDKEEIVNCLFKLENSDTLDLWSRITAMHLDECGAITFFERVVKDYIDFSGRAEAGLRLRNVEACEGLQNVALRTNLKRN